MPRGKGCHRGLGTYLFGRRQYGSLPVMKAFYCDHFVLTLPEGHRFPMRKYSLLRERLLAEEVIPPPNLIVPEAATDTELLLVHDPGYLARLSAGTLEPREVRQIGFPWSPEMVERSRRSAGGTVGACRAALAEGIAANLAGGTHHAFADHGAGFCVFNDVVVAARVLQHEGLIERALIIDCDVHQGDGTAALCAGDPSLFTFSIHGERNFPFRKEQSDLDLALPDGTGDEAYLAILDDALTQVFMDARTDLVIYLAGADPYVGDTLGRLALSKDGLATRDEMVFAHCLSAGLPLAIVMSGGYAVDIADTVDIHFRTIARAAALQSNLAGATR